ncbi:MAG TPA: TonB family protein [Thermodesulfobacteriota bacterium]
MTRATPPPARPDDAGSQIARVEPPRAEPPAAPRRESPVEPPRDLPPPPSPGTTSRGRTSPDPNRRPDTDGDGGDARRPLPGLDRLLPGPSQLARLDPRVTEPRRGTGGQGGGLASDYLPGIEEGEETFLNSREFRYAYYFNQIKRGIAAQWNPQRVLDTTREAVPRESLTELFLVIGKDGRVESAEVTRPSGVPALDAEAVRAVRAAAPYPAPPAGVLDPDGRLRFPFGFAVLAGSGRITYFGPDDRDLRDLFRRPAYRVRP